MPALAYRSCYLIFTATFIFLFSPAFSQKNDFNGYYITPQKDTVRGKFPRYRQWNYNPGKVNFTSQQTGQIELTPLTCKEFHVDNYDTYISYRGTRLTNPIDLNASSSVDNIDTQDSLSAFLRLIATNGSLKFFVYKDQLRINLYYAKNNENLVELQQKAALINDRIWQSKTYQQQLKALFPDGSKNEIIEDISYSEEAISSFVDKLYPGSNISGKIKNNDGGVFVSAGVSINSLKFTSSDNSLEFSSKAYPSKTVPLAAIGYIFVLDRNFGRIFFFPELTVFSFKHNSTTYYNSGSAYPALSNTFQSSPVVSLSFHLGYNILNKPNLKISIAPGAGIALLTKNKQTDDYINSATTTKTVVNKMDNASSVFGIQGTAMISKKYLVWATYNLPTTITNYTSTKGKLTAIQLAVGYKF